MTVCTKSERLDIGHGIFIEKRYADGRLTHIHYWHPHPNGVGDCSGCIAIKPEQADGWDLVSEEPLTVFPSLACRACGHHGYIRDGRWAPA